jgi:hypothetical protein
MLNDTSFTTMTRRPKLGRRRRNFTLEELLTNTTSGLPDEIAPDFANESRNGCIEAAVSETRAPCTEKRCKGD